MMVYKLKGGASAWWDRVQSTRCRNGELPINSWEWMKRLMIEQLLPSDCQQALFKQYHYCQQGVRTVAEYTDKF